MVYQLAERLRAVLPMRSDRLVIKAEELWCAGLGIDARAALHAYQYVRVEPSASFTFDQFRSFIFIRILGRHPLVEG